MKLAAFISAFLFCSVNVFADCAGTGIYFWPSGLTIKQNSIIIIDGYAESQNVVLGLNKKYPVYLKSGGEKVKLIVKEILVGEFYLTQAILTADKILETGKEYQLYIDSLPQYEKPLNRKWNSETGKYEPVKWKVEEGMDVDQPVWLQKPLEVKKTLVHYGCGPATYVHFNFKSADPSEILIRTSVTNLSTGKTTTYYLEPDSKMLLRVGHGMCSGAFLFKDSTEFEVSFDIMDASGNLTTGTDKKIRFTKPTLETNDTR